MFDIEFFRFAATFLKDSGLLPVAFFALLLKVYVFNGNIKRHFSALRRERRLIGRVINHLETLIGLGKENPCVKEGIEEK